MHSLLTKLINLALILWIGVCIRWLVIQNGHNAVCQREIDKLVQESESLIHRDATKIKLKDMQWSGNEAHWLVALPPHKSVTVRIWRQTVNEKKAVQIRTLDFSSGPQPELVALGVYAQAAENKLQVELSKSAALSYDLPKSQNIATYLWSHFATIEDQTIDLSTVVNNAARAFSRGGSQRERTLNREAIISVTTAIDAGVGPVVYGVSLSTEP